MNDYHYILKFLNSKSFKTFIIFYSSLACNIFIISVHNLQILYFITATCLWDLLVCTLYSKTWNLTSSPCIIGVWNDFLTVFSNHICILKEFLTGNLCHFLLTSKWKREKRGEIDKGEKEKGNRIEWKGREGEERGGKQKLQTRIMLMKESRNK